MMIIILIVIVIKKLAITNIPIHDDHNHNPDNIVNGDSYHDMSTNDKKHHNTNSITIITYRYNWIYIYRYVYIYCISISVDNIYIIYMYICIDTCLFNDSNEYCQPFITASLQGFKSGSILPP